MFSIKFLQIFKLWGCDCLLPPKCDCLGKPKWDCLVIIFLYFSFYSLFKHHTAIKHIQDPIFLLLKSLKPLNIKSHSRTLQDLIKKSDLVLNSQRSYIKIVFRAHLVFYPTSHPKGCSKEPWSYLEILIIILWSHLLRWNPPSIWRTQRKPDLESRS